MRKNRLFILGIFTVMVALVSLSLVSGTWAKYTSTVSGEDTARVAKWAFTYTNKNGAAGNIANEIEGIKFDLFNTLTGETHVSATDGSIIAPGTTGSFVLTFTNTSEVTARYAIDYTVDNKGVPLEFKVGDGAWTTDLADVTASDATELAYTNGNASITIQWRWAFEQTDVNVGDGVDTGLGSVATPVSPTVSAEVTFTQVD